MGEPSHTGSNGFHGRDGRFLPGNKAGQGNPHAARVRQLRSLLLDAVTDDDFRAVVAKLVQAAKVGDLPSIKELLDRLLGKPPSAVEVTGADGEPLGVSIGDLQTAIMTALAGFPEARLAVAAKLRDIGTDGRAE